MTRSCQFGRQGIRSGCKEVPVSSGKATLICQTLLLLPMALQKSRDYQDEGGQAPVLNPHPSVFAVVGTPCRSLEGAAGSIFSVQHLCSSPARFPFAEGCVGLNLPAFLEVLKKGALSQREIKLRKPLSKAQLASCMQTQTKFFCCSLDLHLFFPWLLFWAGVHRH